MRLCLVLAITLASTLVVLARPGDGNAKTAEVSSTTHPPTNHKQGDIHGGGHDDGASHSVEDSSEEDDDSNESDEDEKPEAMASEMKHEVVCPPRSNDIVETEETCSSFKHKLNKTGNGEKLENKSKVDGITTDHARHDTRATTPVSIPAKGVVASTMVPTRGPATPPAAASASLEDADDQDEQGQCEYYKCVLEGLDILDDNGKPSLDRLKVVIASSTNQTNIAETPVQVKAVQCFGKSKEMDVSVSQHAIDANATSCEASMKLIKCLSEDTSCPIFLYP